MVFYARNPVYFRGFKLLAFYYLAAEINLEILIAMQAVNDITPGLVSELILAIREAEGHYNEITAIRPMEELEATLEKLPEHFGKLLSSLDLLEPFARIGRMIRGLADAHEVLAKLSGLISEKLELQQAGTARTEIANLFLLCEEISCIRDSMSVSTNIQAASRS